MTDDGRDRFRCLTRIATARRARAPENRRGRAPQTFPRRTLARRWLYPRDPNGPYTALELIMETIGGDGLPKIN